MKKYTLSVHAEKVIEERKIKKEWIEITINNPDSVEPDMKDQELIHHLKVIKENDKRVLRVIYNKSVEPLLIVSSFFDRRMKGKL